MKINAKNSIKYDNFSYGLASWIQKRNAYDCWNCREIAAIDWEMAKIIRALFCIAMSASLFVRSLVFIEISFWCTEKFVIKNYFLSLFFFQSPSEAGNFASGAWGDLNYATFSGTGVVGQWSCAEWCGWWYQWACL